MNKLNIFATYVSMMTTNAWPINGSQITQPQNNNWLLGQSVSFNIIYKIVVGHLYFSQ